MHTELKELLNQQINKELYSAYLYMDIADYFASEGLDGLENHYRLQAQEEYQHAMRFVRYLIDNRQEVILEAIDKPLIEKTDYLQILQAILQHEKYITDSINNIYSTAIKLNDYRCRQMLDWFIAEQNEEEKSADDIITKMRLFGNSQQGLYSINNELKQEKHSDK
ncbi:MAG: ferritin [Erysipelotrichia bacterium]|nr:ferritin [Erysipelotrichia bacterium]